ncbi:MAG: leucine-rich repeat domain-containing protein, partial [Clostridia bacterium]|nr:leucine-rich repeat domain-containing protein [Clostridia bacterium]
DLESLTSVVLPSTITSIGIWAFKNCTSLINITIPNSVTNIDFHAFSGCSSLTNIVIPNSIKMIKQGIFQDCISLTNITLPNTLTYINYDAFYNTGFWNDENNWENNGTVLYLGNYLISGRYIDDWGNCTRETTGEYTIKDGTTLIGYAAFYGCRNLKNITIPRSITIINDRAMGWYWSDSGDPSTEAGGNGDNVLISGFTITGYTNTAAHTYATNNGIPFIDIEKPNTQPTQPSTQPSQPSTHTHSWKYVLTRKATCTEDGYNAYKCSCGQVKTESIKANGHSYVYRYKSATYFASGYECEKCLTCGKTKDYVTYKKLKLQKPNPLYFGYKGKINIYEYTTGVTHYKVQVKGNGRNIIKTFKAKYGSIDKNIKNLKKGKYKFRVKAIVKKGGKKLQSKWSKFRKVTVY